MLSKSLTAFVSWFDPILVVNSRIEPEKLA